MKKKKLSYFSQIIDFFFLYLDNIYYIMNVDKGFNLLIRKINNFIEYFD